MNVDIFPRYDVSFTSRDPGAVPSNARSAGWLRRGPEGSDRSLYAGTILVFLVERQKEPGPPRVCR